MKPNTRNGLFSVLAILAAAFMITGCGGNSLNSGSTVSQSSAFNGIYRTAFTRGNTAVTVYLNYPDIEVVVTDEGGVYPSFVGTSTSGVTLTNGTYSFTGIPLSGSDGESAQATGTFASTNGANTISLTITGGIGYTGTVPFVTTSTNSLYVGTYGGTYAPSYTVGSSTTTEAAGTVTSLTLKADTTTGGYDMTASGATVDPTGVPVTFTITDAQVDPCGIIPNLTVVFVYSNGSSSVTNTYTDAFLNLGVVATTTLVESQRSTSTTWPDGASESDTMVLTQSSTIGLKKNATK